MIFRSLIVGLVCCCQIATVDAAVTVVRHYRLGEADPGAVTDGVATNSVDSVGGNTMTLLGAPLYSADFPTNVGPVSSRSIRFTGTNYGSASIVSDLTNNFGVEAWVKPATDSGTNYVFYNGHTAGNGWGILQIGTNYAALFGGVTLFGSAPVLVNQWTHLAVVRNYGIATFYVNGVPAGSSASPPNAPDGSCAIATTPVSPGSGTWNGWLDEVRVFTFVPIEFQPGDLLTQVSLALIDFSQQDSAFRLTWSTNVSRNYGLEFTTNLPSTNWSKLQASITNGLFTVMDSITDAGRFYRLNGQAGPPCGTNLPPYLPAGFYLLTNGSPVTSTNITIALDSSAVHTFDASAFVDPSRCEPDVLSWFWTVQRNGSNISAGVSGQRSPVLGLSNSIFTGNYQLGLDVRGSSGLTTNKTLDVTFTGKPPCDTNIPLQLGLSVWRDFPDAVSNYFTSSFSGGVTYVFQSNGVPAHTLQNNRPTNFFEVRVIGEATNCVSDYTYDWDIEVIGGPAPYAPRGISGYLTPKLTVLQNALPDTQGAQLIDVHVIVTRLSDGKRGDFIFYLINAMSELSILMSTDCQEATEACETCPCTIETALPTNEPN
jgi:hypothetical protein